MINIYIMKNDIVRIVLIVAGAAVLFYLITSYNNRRLKASEGLDNINTSESDNPNMLSPEMQDEITNNNPNIARKDNKKVNFMTEESGNNSFEPTASEPNGQNEVYKQIGSFDSPSNTYLAQTGFPKDQLTPGELLPKDTNSKWAQVNPSSQGNLGDQNFLTAAYHVGINTVGQTMRNANLQLRSEPANPRDKVSPWQQTTIEPDSNRRPLEIGGAC